MKGTDVIKCSVRGCNNNIHDDGPPFNERTGLCDRHCMCPYCGKAISENPIGQPICSNCFRFWSTHEIYGEDVAMRLVDGKLHPHRLRSEDVVEFAELKVRCLHQEVDIKRLRGLLLDSFGTSLGHEGYPNKMVAVEVLNMARESTKED